MLGSHELSSQAGSQRKRLHLWGGGRGEKLCLLSGHLSSGL